MTNNVTRDQTMVAIIHSLRKPVLAGLLSYRTGSLLLGIVGSAQIGLVTAGAPGWPCPFKALFGLPCPGCGITTAISLLLKGDWRASLHTHIFAPVFLFVVVLFLLVPLLPEPARTRIIAMIGWFEQRTGLLFLGFLLLLGYWGLRLI